MRGTFEEPPTGLIPWFSKLREILMLHFAPSPSPLRGKPMQAQDVAASTKDTSRNTKPCAGNPVPSSLSSVIVSVVLRRSPAEIVLHQQGHHAVVLPVLIYYFARLAGSRRRGCHPAERVLNAELPYVRYLIGTNREGVRLHQPR